MIFYAVANLKWSKAAINLIRIKSIQFFDAYCLRERLPLCSFPDKQAWYMEISLAANTEMLQGPTYKPGTESMAILPVFFGKTSSQDNITEDFITALSENEVSRMNRFRHPVDRNCYIAVHALLRKKLSADTQIIPRNIEIISANNNKPFIRDYKKDFNISHSDSMFAFSIAPDSSVKIGVDIEVIKEIDNIYSIAKDCFCDSEMDFIFRDKNNESENLGRFYELWTCKEALLKMIGIGLYVDLKSIKITPGLNTFKIHLPEEFNFNANKAFLYCRRFDNFVISVSITERHEPQFVDAFSEKTSFMN